MLGKECIDACSENIADWPISITTLFIIHLGHASSNTYLWLVGNVVKSHNDQTILYIWLIEGKKRRAWNIYDNEGLKCEPHNNYLWRQKTVSLTDTSNLMHCEWSQLSTLTPLGNMDRPMKWTIHQMKWTMTGHQSSYLLNDLRFSAFDSQCFWRFLVIRQILIVWPVQSPWRGLASTFLAAESGTRTKGYWP